MERTPRAEAKARTRQRLLDSAEALFLEHGFAATSLDQIAADAGITKPAIYRHFQSKEDLFLAVRQRRVQLADVSAVTDSAALRREWLADVGRGVGSKTAGLDIRGIALQLEFRAVSLRRPEARRRFGDEIRAFVAAAGEESVTGPALRSGVTEAEVLLLGQMLVEALVEYRAFVPDLITDDTFATALSLFAGLLAEEETPARSRR